MPSGNNFVWLDGCWLEGEFSPSRRWSLTNVLYSNLSINMSSDDCPNRTGHAIGITNFAYVTILTNQCILFHSLLRWCSNGTWNWYNKFWCDIDSRIERKVHAWCDKNEVDISIHRSSSSIYLLFFIFGICSSFAFSKLICINIFNLKLHQQWTHSWLI